MPDVTALRRDIIQADIKIPQNQERMVFIQAPVAMDLPRNMVLQVVRPLYGMPESGLHWYLTYLDHHITCLGMTEPQPTYPFSTETMEDCSVAP